MEVRRNTDRQTAYQHSSVIHGEHITSWLLASLGTSFAARPQASACHLSVCDHSIASPRCSLRDRTIILRDPNPWYPAVHHDNGTLTNVRADISWIHLLSVSLGVLTYPDRLVRHWGEGQTGRQTHICLSVCQSICLCHQSYSHPISSFFSSRCFKNASLKCLFQFKV